MSNSSPYPEVVLQRGREISIYRKHPWVFSGAIKERRGEIANGAMVDVVSHDGKFLGAGHWGTGGIAVRLLTISERLSESEILQKKITAAISLRKALGLVGNSQTTGFRVVHGEGDGLPGLVIDKYADVCVVQCHSNGMWRVREEIAAIIQASEELGISRIVFKSTEKANEEEKSAESVSDLVTIQENSLNFIVDVGAGQKTGFFLDQRVNREVVRGLAKGRQVLNAFSYSGAFSVYALQGGASWVMSVDASKSAVELCRQNVALNFPSPSHSVETADCFNFLSAIEWAYDMIILDPPAFAKHQKAVQRGLQGYEAINTLAVKGIKPGGILVTFSCSQLVSRDLFRDVVLRSAAAANRPVRILHQLHQAPCHPINLFHPEGDYLKGFVLLVD